MWYSLSPRSVKSDVEKDRWAIAKIVLLYPAIDAGLSQFQLAGKGDSDSRALTFVAGVVARVV